MEVVWDGEHAFLEVAKESTEFVDIVAQLQTIYSTPSAEEERLESAFSVGFPKVNPKGWELWKEGGATCEESL